VKAVTKISGF